VVPSSRSASPPPAPYPLSLHDALPISRRPVIPSAARDLLCPSSRPLAALGMTTLDDGNPCPRLQPLPAFGPQREKPHRRTFRRRSEEHTSELQSRENLVCRLLLEKKKY